jgi:creatinine amidohydrolase
MRLGPLVSELTWVEFEEAAKADYLLILPVGSTEQHGPHLPLSTDVILPMEIGKGIASKIDALVAPAVNYGYYSRARSGGGETFPGTTSVSASTLIQLVSEILSSYISDGFRRVLVLNGHFENLAVLPEAIDRAIAQSHRDDVRAICLTWAVTLTEPQIRQIWGQEYPGEAIDHAAVTETSLMLFLKPEMVRQERIPDEKTQRIVHYDIIPAPIDTYTRAGSLWTAKGSTKEKGETIYNKVVKDLVEIVQRDMAKS